MNRELYIHCDAYTYTMHSLSSSRQDTQDTSSPHKTCSSNSLPLTLSPFPFPLFLYWRSPLPFCLLFLFPSSSISWAMLAVNISFCNLDFISCHVFTFGPVTYIFKVRIFCTFSFLFAVFFYLYYLLWLCLFSVLSLLLFLQLLHGLQSYKGVLFPVGLPARKTAIPRAAYIVLTVPLYLSGCNSLVSTFPSDGSGFKWYIRWLRFFSNLIERSSGIAVSCFSVLAVYSVSYFLMRGFQFFRFIYMPFLLYAL